MDYASNPPAGIAFGRFRVLPHSRELLAAGQPIKLGGRAFDVLMALIEARGVVLGKDTLMARVWPDRVVEENALQVQLSALRTALGADRELIRTVFCVPEGRSRVVREDTIQRRQVAGAVVHCSGELKDRFLALGDGVEVARGGQDAVRHPYGLRPV